MSHIRQLIEKIFNNEAQVDVDSLKKLIYLAVNDTSSFHPYAKEIAELMSDALPRIEDDILKLLVLQLLSEMATNYTQSISSDCYDFSQIIALLSDQNAEVRKASHYLLLIFVKKYQKIDEILQGYLEKVKQNAEHWKKIQKIIHSFQSLLVIQPKCVTYGQDYHSMDDFLAMLVAYRAHQHNLIQKASEQTVTSFVKNQYVPQIIEHLNPKLQQELAQFAVKLNVNLTNRKQSSESEEIEQIKVSKKLEKQKNQLQILLDQILNESDWKIKSDTIEEISKKLINQANLDIPEDLVDKILDFTYDYNFKICITAMNIIFTLISHYPKETQTKLKKIEDIIIQKICDLKMAVRQIANKILKKIFSIQSKESLKKLLNKLSNCSVVGKQQILNFLQQLYSSAVPIDLNLVLTEISNQFANENTRIKIKTLDCLVKISVSNNVEECKLILQRKLNKVYFDMFLDRLKEKISVDQKGGDKWEDKNFNKGMTWQAERSAPITEPNDRFLTKVEFGRKNDKPPVQEDTISDFKYEAPLRGKDLRDTKDQSKFNYGAVSTANCTANTFDTIKSQDVSTKAKKVTESYKPSAFSNFESSELEINQTSQQKKLPLKPNPVKKRPTVNNQNIKEQDPPNNNLVIQSKQYRNKNNLDEIKEQKPAKSVRLTKNKEKEKVQEQDKYSERAKQPFSIKKSASKKQHQIDYKATQYITKQELAPVDSPKDALKEITVNLPKDNDWSKQFDSLDILRRLLKNHQEMYPLIYQALPTIMPEVLKLVDSLRSTLAKNGMITLSQMCECLKKAMDPFLEGIFVKLFRKAQDANTFIVEEVRKCMTSLCRYCTPSKICAIIINNSQAKAVPIKTKIALCIDKILEKQNYDLQALKENQKLLGVMGNLITDSSVEVRNLTRQIFFDICQNNSKQEVESIFKKSSKDVWDKWKSILEKEGK